MNKSDMAYRMLDILHSSAERNHEASFRIRGWCITVWMASLAFIMSSDFSLSETQKTVFPFLPIALFWLLDGFQNTFKLVHGRTAGRVEEAIATENLEQLDMKNLLYYSSYPQIPYSEKVRAFFAALFTLETVVFFYIVLTAVTCVIVLA